jgi:hypothetical protein
MMRQRTFQVDDVRWTVFLVDAPVLNAIVPEALRAGWLCFESAQAKRRLAPVPERWEAFSDDQLRALHAQAAPVLRAGSPGSA